MLIVLLQERLILFKPILWGLMPVSYTHLSYIQSNIFCTCLFVVKKIQSETFSRVKMKINSIKFNFIMNLILTVSNFLFPLITFPYVSRVLLPEGTGKVAFAVSVITYFSMLATFGVNSYGAVSYTHLSQIQWQTRISLSLHY